MVIGIDGNEANVEKKVGVSVYTYELLSRFETRATKDLRFVVYLRSEPLPHMPKSNQFFEYKIVAGKRFWRDSFFPWYLFTHNKPDVLFSPAHYTPRFSPVPIVTTIHDLSYFYFPDEFLKKDLYKLKNWTQHAVSQSAKIITVSDHTRNDVLKNYGMTEKDVIRIYNGFTNPTKNYNDEVLKKIGISKAKYILFVGTVQPRKNLQTLIKAFVELQKNENDMKLVIVGKKGWLYEPIVKVAAESDIKEKIIFTGFIDNESLSSLYKNAFVFAHPSLYEGFGIPVLEAMAHGCPVIAAKGSSLEEIGDDACLYFDPHDTIELSNRINELLKSPKLRNELIKKGKERVTHFSWDSCAESTLDVLKNIANKKYER